MLPIMFGVESHTGERAYNGLHCINLSSRKRAAFQDRAIAEEHAGVEVLDEVVLSTGNGGGGEVIRDRFDAKRGEVLLEPVGVSFFLIAFLLHARQVQQRIGCHHERMAEL